MRPLSVLIVLICLISLSCKQEPPIAATTGGNQVQYKASSSSGNSIASEDGRIMGLWIDPHANNPLWDDSNLASLKNYYGFSKMIMCDMPGERDVFETCVNRVKANFRTTGSDMIIVLSWEWPSDPAPAGAVLNRTSTATAMPYYIDLITFYHSKGIYDFLIDEPFDTNTLWGSTVGEDLVWNIADYLHNHNSRLHLTSGKYHGESYPWNAYGLKYKSLCTMYNTVSIMNDSYFEYAPGREWVINSYNTAYGSQSEANWLCLDHAAEDPNDYDRTSPYDNLMFSTNRDKNEIWVYAYDLRYLSQFDSFRADMIRAGW